MMRRVRQRQQEADLDITSFMNLMIILVPVLLMSMVFSHITVLDLKLPDLAAADSSPQDIKNQKLELVIYPDYIDVNFPAGVRLQRVGKVEKTGGPKTAALADRVDNTKTPVVETYDFVLLSNVLQEVKRRLKEKQVDKKDILILSQTDTDYQTLVSVMDTVRSFKTVVAASVVDAELFPEISLGDAPLAVNSKADQVAAITGGAAR